MQMGHDQRIDIKQGIEVDGQVDGWVANFGTCSSGKTRICAFRCQHRIDQKSHSTKGDVLCGITDLRDVHGVRSTCWVSGVIVECCPEDECGQMGD